MSSNKLSCTIFLSWMIFRINQNSEETKTDGFHARSNFRLLKLDNAVTSVDTRMDTTESSYSFLLRRVLKTRRHRLKSPLRISQVCWTKHGQTYLSPADFHKGIDLIVYMDVESNLGPSQSDNANTWSNNTDTANFSSNHGNIKIDHLNIRC